MAMWSLSGHRRVTHRSEPTPGSDFSHLIIGGGLIGMVAAKYLAVDGAPVCVFAPPEPLDHRKPHAGPGDAST